MNAKAEMIIIAGNSHPELAEMIASRVRPLGDCRVYKRSEETKVEIGDSLRGKDVFIIQTGSKEPNDNVMELLIMCYACKTSCARNIIGVIPYLPYSKQSKMKKRGCIVSKLVAKMLTKAGMTHLITMDLHQKEIQGFFDMPVDNLRASPFLINYIQHKIPDYRNAIIVARNPGQAKRATAFAERLRLGIAVIHGDLEKELESESNDGRNSPPPVSTVLKPQSIDSRKSVFELPNLAMPIRCNPKEKLPMDVVGDVSGRIAIIVEDMIDDVDAFRQSAEILKERGAYKVYVMATHGLLSSDAPRLIDNSSIDEVVVTNTVPHEVAKMQCHRIKTVDISLLISEAIRRIHNQESMSYLFRDITAED
jgi:phosphoribosylpyrophosphate synthetase